ncbi:hypothetical protein DJ021_08600 [Phenylobacterium hankyongense]|uniref:Uncharacterized protein n=1 Tax=Phenylobacterium hankyongense TaxID=1813876 RepID=A0A328B0B0_9CAUL|nr:hypothetical protein [Phenylobacterium hankyongense]RAK59861.1 hypothetical protein DJ021_08600 [Phenylobacterium hankyongense]
MWTATLIVALAGGYAVASDPTDSWPSPTSRTSPEAAAEQGPSVRIARRVVDAAGAFERFVRTASAVGPDFDGAASVSGALMASAAYDPRQLEEGAVAYASLVALQEPAFVEALQRLAADPAERAGYVDRLTATPDLVLELAGAPQAAAMASDALNGMGATLVSRGRVVKQAAYTVQHQPWALEPVTQPEERLARVEAAGGTRARLSESETRQLLTGVVARRRDRDDDLAAPRPTATVLRGLALAAAAVLGQAGESRTDALSRLLSEPDNGACLRRAKLNLHQCVAASGPQYEDVFCVGEYAMGATGQCIVKAAGGSDMSDGIRVPIARGYGSGGPDSVSVPVARGSSTRETGAPDSGARDFGTRDSAARDYGTRDYGARDSVVQDPLARDPHVVPGFNPPTQAPESGVPDRERPPSSDW